jgi:cytochrome c
MAGLFFEGGTVSSENQIPTPTRTLTALERLAEPTVPAEPSQADLGAQDYWLYCLPCHGDRGQGLTDEFRETYPPDEVNCWQAGCHGKRPYENGFSLPTAIPAVIAHDAVTKFTDAAQLNSYIRVAMPYWNPGTLTEEQAWRITAFILSENGLWNGVGELNASNAGDLKIMRGTPTPPGTPQQVLFQKSLTHAGKKIDAPFLHPIRLAGQSSQRLLRRHVEQDGQRRFQPARGDAADGP